MIYLSVILFVLLALLAVLVSWWATRRERLRLVIKPHYAACLRTFELLFCCGCHKPYWGVGGMCAGHCATGTKERLLKRSVERIVRQKGSKASILAYRAILSVVSRTDDHDKWRSLSRFDEFIKSGTVRRYALGIHDDAPEKDVTPFVVE